MNLLLFPAVLLFISAISCTSKSASRDSSYFEGTIIYKGDFVRKTEKYDSTTLALIAGNKIFYHLKDGNSLTEVDNGITTRMLYRLDDNKFYRERFNSDSVYWTRSDKAGPKILKFTKSKNAERILDIDCDAFKVIYEDKTLTFYYNPDTLKTNPDWAKNSTSYNEDFVARETKSIILKTVFEYKDFTIIQTAIKIIPERINDTIFNIPHKPLIEDN